MIRRSKRGAVFSDLFTLDKNSGVVQFVWLYVYVYLGRSLMTFSVSVPSRYALNDECNMLRTACTWTAYDEATVRNNSNVGTPKRDGTDPDRPRRDGGTGRRKNKNKEKKQIENDLSPRARVRDRFRR